MQTYTGTEMDEWRKRVEQRGREDRAWKLGYAIERMADRYADALAAEMAAAFGSGLPMRLRGRAIPVAGAVQRRRKAMARLLEALKNMAEGK